MAAKMAMVLLALCASPVNADEVTVVIDSSTGGEEAAPPLADENHPRILTVLTTYNERTPYIKAYREAIGTRTDGYEPVVSVERLLILGLLLAGQTPVSDGVRRRGRGRG